MGPTAEGVIGEKYVYILKGKRSLYFCAVGFCVNLLNRHMFCLFGVYSELLVRGTRLVNALGTKYYLNLHIVLW